MGRKRFGGTVLASVRALAVALTLSAPTWAATPVELPAGLHEADASFDPTEGDPILDDASAALPASLGCARLEPPTCAWLTRERSWPSHVRPIAPAREPHGRAASRYETRPPQRWRNSCEKPPLSLGPRLRLSSTSRGRPGGTSPDMPPSTKGRPEAFRIRRVEETDQPPLPTAPTLRVLRSLEELDALAPAWRALQWHPFGDFDYYREVAARKPGFLRPHVVALERDGRVVGLVVASLIEEAIPWRVGSVRLAQSRARMLRIGSVGLMGTCDRAGARAVLANLMASLEHGEADVVYLHQIDTRAPLLQEARELPSGLARDRFVRTVPGWSLAVPASYDDFVRSRSKAVRKNMRRYANLMQRELGDVRVACYRAREDLERILQDCVQVAKRTYHERLGQAFADTPATREFVRYALAAGWFRAYVLYVEERPIAFAHALRYGAHLFARETGFDPAFGAYRPGTYLLVRMIEDHCGNGTQRIDYGVMDAEYKRLFGSDRDEFASAYVFARSVKGLSLGIKRAVTGSLDRIARSMLGSDRARRLSRLVRIPTSKA